MTHKQKNTQVSYAEASELVRKTLPTVNWIIDYVLPEGCTLLFASPKTGKSMLVLKLACDLVSQMDGGDVVYYSLDSRSEADLQDRLRGIMGRRQWHGKIWYTFEAPTVDNGLIDEMDRALELHPATKVVVVESLANVRPARKGTDVYQQDYDALQPFALWAEKHHIAVIVVHHTSKRGADGDDWIAAVNGSAGLTASAQTLWGLERERNSSMVTVRMTGHFVEDQRIVLSLKRPADPWTRLVGNETEPVEGCEDYVMAILAQADTALTASEVEERANGLLYTRIRQTLMCLRSHGQVITDEFGAWRIRRADDPQPPSEPTPTPTEPTPPIAPACERVRAALSSEPQSPAQLAALLDVPQNTVRNALHRLCNGAQAVRIADGLYTAPPAEAAALAAPVGAETPTDSRE